MSSQSLSAGFSQTKALPLTPALFRYIEEYGGHADPRVEALRQESITSLPKDVYYMLEPTTSSVLEWQLRGTKGLRVLELGTFTGVTTLALALIAKSNQNETQAIPLCASLEDPKKAMLTDAPAVIEAVRRAHQEAPAGVKVPVVFTIDVNPSVVEKVSMKHWESNDVLGQPLVFLTGNALEIIDQLAAMPEMQNSFDLIFVDADKAGYPHYYEKAVELLAPGGIVALDNILWKGRVTQMLDEETAANAEVNTKILHGVNARVNADPRVDNVCLPIGDGLHLARKL